MKPQTTIQDRAVDLILSGNVALSAKNGNGKVKSQSGDGFYLVDVRNNYACTCPAKGSKLGLCKHALAVKLTYRALSEARNPESEIVDIQSALGMMNEDGYMIAYKALAWMGREGYERVAA